MSYFASEMQKDWRMAPPSHMFGRYFLDNLIERNRYGAANAGLSYWSEVEVVMNRIGAAVVEGCPLIRCTYAAGGAESVVYNTYVAGGADSGTSTDGCFLNFCGISAFQITDEAAGNQVRQLFLHFPNLTVVAANGAVITQAVTGATGTVIGSSIVFSYLHVLDLGTGVWNVANVVADSGLTLVPAGPIPRNLVYGTLDANGFFEGNADSRADDAAIWSVIRGYTPAFVQGDDAGTGYNGDIADCTPLTWSDNIIALVASGFQNTADHETVDVYVNPDNVIAHAMQAAGDNSGNLRELILVYVRADEPLVHITNSLQGYGPHVQR